jgi:isopentenyl diphosphate isomerase/L-lactate dehydrogenase-like FMN-dependent dehydrogenase
MKAASINDYRELARRRLPHFLFEYIDGGSYAEATLRRNLADLERVALRQRVLRDVSALDLTTTLFGQRLSLLVVLAPVGLAGLNARRGLEWIRSQWKGPLIIKGILDETDARSAADLGADALVVSNHGGRQLDGTPSTVSALPAIAAAVGTRLPVLVDGGARSGLDVVRMLALGARAVLLGRAWVYALAADGEAGVSRMKAHGVHNYSIFLLEQTLQLFAYVEIGGERRRADIAMTPSYQRWWHSLREIMPHRADGSPGTLEAHEIFHLD